MDNLPPPDPQNEELVYSLYGAEFEAIAFLPGTRQLRSDPEYWLTRTPGERFRAMDYLRRLTFGNTAVDAPMVRVLEVLTWEQVREPGDPPLHPSLLGR